MAKTHPERKKRSQLIKEIVFQGEGYASAILAGKYSTVRLDSARYNGLRAGDDVLAVCKKHPDDEEPVLIPLTILNSERAPICELDRPVLATNGFLSHEQAADRLTEIYGQEVGIEDMVRNIMYLPTEVYEKLTPLQQILVLTLSPKDLVRDPRTREIFLPAMFYTHAYQGYSLTSWMGFCELNGIISIEEMNRLCQLVYKDKYIGALNAAHMFSNPEKMWDILDAEEFVIYDRMVLLVPVKQDGESRRRRLR